MTFSGTTCANCGCDQMAGAQFCARCGRRTALAASGDWATVGEQPLPFAAAAAIPRGSEQQVRVGQNLQALGIAWCFFGAYRMIAVSAAMHAARAFGWMGHMGHGFWPAIGFTTMLFSGLSILAGVGLLARRPWARGLAIFLGVLSLVKLPVGTALGIYTLWVLGPRAAREEWRRMQVA